jgi:protein gp138
MTYNPPSRNPTDNDSMVGMFNLVLQKFLQNFVDDMLPAQVVSYNRTTNLAQVQPLIQRVTTGGTIVTRAAVQSVPVFQLGGGGFVLNFPIKAGDLGWLKANDCDISLFKQLWRMVIPNTARRHDFADSIFFPSILTGFTIQTPDSANTVLQNLAGTFRVSLGPGNACITDESGYSQSTSALLDLQSTTRAFKLPVMSGAQKTAISSPQKGMMVWDSTENAVSTYNGSVWS